MSNRATFYALFATGLIVSSGCTANESVATGTTVKADIWADNWFALYAGDQLIKEDSVRYKTEQSFNSESFTFDIVLPARLSVVMKDFMENDTGLEYIGSRRQQMGDGGFKGQFLDAESGAVIAVSNEDWRCITIHQAPINKSCARSSNPENDCQASIKAEPDGWKNADFDDSDWPNAVVHSAQAVRPHGGYSGISWQSEAEFIWSDDLETDNIVLCRFTLPAPE